MNTIYNYTRDLLKKTCVILVAGAILFIPLSCDVTDLEPVEALSESTAFETPERVELTIVGVYDAAQSGFYAGSASTTTDRVVRGYPFGAAHVQQGEMRGEDMVNVSGFYAIIYQNNYTPATPNNVYMWATLFGLINQANVAIVGVRTAGANGVITPEVAAAYEGEARFLRALAYHQLLIHFARPYVDNAGNNPGVPFRDFPVNTPDAVQEAIQIGRNTVAECYTRILEDLDYAEVNLPDSREGNINVTRANKGAAIALKTRIKLHQADWTGVIAEGNKLISATAPFTSPISGFTLMPNPEDPFANNFTAESVFSIENNDVDNPDVNGALPTMLGSPEGGARGLVAISPILYNAPFWLPDDLRRTTLLINDGRRYYTFKYRDYVTRGDNAPIIRYPEVLLNVAEAIARTSGVDARAVELLNAVRNRAVRNPADQFTAASFANGVTLTQAILNERRIEFSAEGLRWADITRLSLDPDFSTGGIPAKMSNANASFANYDPTKSPESLPKDFPAIPYNDFRFLWPIPAEELAQNPTLASQQNPNW